MYCWPPPDLIARLCHICNSVTLRRRRQRRSSFVKTRGHLCVISPPRLLDGRMLMQHVIVSKPNCPRAGLRVLRALLTRHDQRGNFQRSDRLSGIILASVCRYLGRPGNPPERWAGHLPFGVRAHKPWSCDSCSGGAASQIYSGNQTEPGASPNPADDSSAALPEINLQLKVSMGTQTLQYIPIIYIYK